MIAHPPSPLLDTIFSDVGAAPSSRRRNTNTRFSFFFLVRVTFVPWMTVAIADYPLLPSLVDLKLNS